MKKNNLIILILLLSMTTLGSCTQLLSLLDTTTPPSSTQQKQTNKPATSVLGSIFDAIMGNQPLQQERMIGQWSYKGTAVAFQSENLLKKAGGEVVATEVERKFDQSLQKIGVTSANTYFVFNQDSTYQAKVAGIKLAGKYTLQPQQRKVRLTYLMGLATLDADIALSNDRMQLLMEGDAMLRLMKTLSQFTDNSSVAVLGKMADMYDGLLLGFDLKR